MQNLLYQKELSSLGEYDVVVQPEPAEKTEE